MSYKDWFEAHALKHEEIVSRLKSQNFDEAVVISYFDFDNMSKKEPTFCRLYKENKKCHDMKELNCYLCACPNFRFNDNGFKKIETKTQYSYCDIDSKDGRQGVYGEAIHQDCSGCTVPHHVNYIKQHFQWSWRSMMKNCTV